MASQGGGKRGPPVSGGAPSRQGSICQVEGCGAVVHGEVFREHYKKLVDEKYPDMKIQKYLWADLPVKIEQDVYRGEGSHIAFVIIKLIGNLC